jgi:hypothetical protein
MIEHVDQPNEETIIELFQAGRLADYIFSYTNLPEDEGPILDLFVTLHNQKKIDLLSVASGEQFERISNQTFFAGQHVFCAVIPKLHASVTDMMLAVDRLVKKAGEDLASNQPNGAFKIWCATDPARAKEIIERAEKDDELAIHFLTFALEIDGFFEEALRVGYKYDGPRRLSAIVAISRIKLLGSIQVEKAFEFYEAALTGSKDDALYSNILHGAFAIVSKHNECDGALLKRITECVGANPGPQVHYCCAQILWMHTKFITADILSVLTRCLATLDPSHRATARQIDIGLTHLLKTPLALDGIQLLRDLLIKYEDDFKLSEFSSFSHELPKHEDVFHKVLVEWLMLGERSLCDGMSHLVSGSKLSNQPVSLSAANVELSPSAQIFLCRKAIGYFFMHPVFAASIVVSVLRNCSIEVAKVIEAMLFDPMLRNYGGKLREYLTSIGAGDAAFEFVKSALEQNERYLADINSVGEIAELSPSERQKQIVHRMDSDEVRRSHKKAMSESVLLNMVHRSVILYGKRTLTVIQGPGAERRLMEMDLKSHSFGWELPRSTIIDPVGLDFLFRVFRNERIRNEAHPA